MLEQIIEKLKKDYGQNGCYNVLKSWVEDPKTQENDYGAGINYGSIKGMLWGLYATGFITESERQEALNELREI